MSIKKAIETKKLAEIVSNYENLVLSDNDILFLQFISDNLDKNQLNGLQDWLYDKLTKQVKPKYKEEFNVELECSRFPTHFEIKNIEKLPEEKVLKIFKMFEWVLNKF
ncbi:MAG: hypothetical protein HWN67_08535 [Candidatus Helarchaeota archaeon]|nr:hypothetical protein [Candidatus Helarchaeota archaeon]